MQILNNIVNMLLNIRFARIDFYLAKNTMYTQWFYLVLWNLNSIYRITVTFGINYQNNF